jgi:S-adenosylmethionine decarboxylase
MSVGTEWLIDAGGCAPAALRELQVVRAVCERVLRELDLRVIGEGHWHQFPGPGGLTGLYLLTESHLACHTYPEYGIATFNLHCCRPRSRWNWEGVLRETLQASQVEVREFSRGSLGTEGVNR